VADRSVEILLKANDQVTGPTNKAAEALRRLGGSGSGSRGMTLFDEAGTLRTLALVGKVNVAFGTVRAITQAMKGDWESVSETIKTLPFGIGAVAKNIEAIVGDITGLTRSTEMLNASIASMERFGAFQAGIGGSRLSAVNALQGTSISAADSLRVLSAGSGDRPFVQSEVAERRSLEAAQRTADAAIAAMQKAMSEEAQKTADELSRVQAEIDARSGPVGPMNVRALQDTAANRELVQRRAELQSQLSLLQPNVDREVAMIREALASASDGIRKAADAERANLLLDAQKMAEDRIDRALDEWERTPGLPSATVRGVQASIPSDIDLSTTRRSGRFSSITGDARMLTRLPGEAIDAQGRTAALTERIATETREQKELTKRSLQVLERIERNLSMGGDVTNFAA